MKTTMKLFAALTIMLGFSVTMLAQTQTITAHAAVWGTSAIDNIRNLEFANLTLAGGPKTVDLAGAATGNITVPGATNQGTFRVTKAYSAGTTVFSLTYPNALTGSISGTLPITYVANWNTNVASGITGNAFVCGATSGTATVPAANTDPTLYVHVAGTVTPDAGNTVAGIYTGTITLSATFN